MGDQTGTGRPRNPDGTVNWTVVFDDPNKGIFAAIDKASSARQLDGLIAQIGPLLFQRKNDTNDLLAFTSMMTSILKAETELGLEETRDRLRDALEAEKNNRIRKAEEYIANKRSGQSIDRRSSHWGLSFKQAFFGTPLRIAMVTGVFLVFCGFGVFSQIDFDAKDAQNDTKAEAEQPAPPPKDESEPVKEAPKKPEQKQKLYTVYLMKPVIVDTTAGRQSLVPLIIAPALEEASTLCRFAPKFIEGVLFRTSAASETKSKLSSSELSSIGVALRNDANSFLKEQLIQTIHLVDTRKLDKQALRAAYRGCGKHNMTTDPEDLLG